MKRLILLRHAKSSWADPGLPDFERPLSGRGERDAPRMGLRLRARRERPSLILSSPAKRARRTAELIAQALDYPREFLQLERSLYAADASALAAVVRAQPEQFSSLLVVAHNPGLTDLANRLLPAFALDNLPTAGIVAADFAIGQWSKLADGAGTLAYYDFPKNPDLIVIED